MPPPPALGAWEMWKGYARKHPTNAVLMVVLMLMWPILYVVNPMLLSKFVSAVQAKSGAGKYLVWLAIANIFVVGAYNVDLMLHQDFYVTMQAHVAEEIMDFLFLHKRESVETLHTAELVIKTKAFATNMSRHINDIRNTLVPNVLTLVLQAVYLLSIDPVLSGVVFLMSVVTITSLHPSLLPCRKQGVQTTESHAAIFEHLDEVMHNMGTVVNHDGFTRESDEIRSRGRAARKGRRSLVLCSLRKSMLITLAVGLLSTLFSFRVYNRFVKPGRSDSLGKATAAVAILFEVISVTKESMYHVFNMNSETSALDAVIQTFNALRPTHQQRADPEGGEEGKEDEGISLSGVEFTYAGAERPTFRSLSVDFPVGTKTLLKGPNGAGKSTILRLLNRHMVPSQGTARLGGRCAQEVPLQEWHQKVGYVDQHAELFDRSIRDNLIYGHPGLEAEELERRLRDFGLWEFFSKFEQGLDTPVGKAGSHLSGGQRQVVQLLRVILQDPAIILLDEVTAGVDVAHTEVVMNLVDRLFQGKTVIMVTHDPELVRRASRTVDLETLQKAA